MVVTLGLIRSMGLAVPEAWNTIARNRAVTDGPTHQGMSAQLYSGLLWVRDHTPTCAVFAVNNHYLEAHARDPRYFYYSAFAERRVFLESWEYPAHWDKAQPFPARMALNTAATQDGQSAALRQLGREGVRYALIDNTHGSGAPEPASVSRLVFANPALAVYELTSRPSGRESGGICA